MKVLVFGPSGAGKTYISSALQKSGINAYDSDDIEGLSAWCDKQGNKISAPATAGEALHDHYSFLWDKRFLETFLKGFTDVYVFGGSGNLFSMLDLFDKTFFLKVEPALQKDRILNGSRATPLMDFDEGSIVTWGDWLEQEAKKRSILSIDASLTTKEIFEIIR
jgi:hypothetical protein